MARLIHDHATFTVLTVCFASFLANIFHQSIYHFMVAFVLFVGLDNKDIHNTSSLLLYVAPVYNLTMLSGFLFYNPGCIPDAEGLFINSVGASESLLNWFNRSLKHHQYVCYLLKGTWPI